MILPQPPGPNTFHGKGSKLTAEVRHNTLDYFNEHRQTSYHSAGKVIKMVHKQKQTICRNGVQLKKTNRGMVWDKEAH